jgi:hypothetical protein
MTCGHMIFNHMTGHHMMRSHALSIITSVLAHSITHRPGSGAQTTWEMYKYL